MTCYGKEQERMKRQKKYNQIKDVTDNIRIAIYMRILSVTSLI